ncbi:MAG: aminotransferase class V-fold PLP-dependent enzyme [Planctomycetes bacterium]|nr:aminotransferase class V-fold PLP-dependent enzyme [Planctomycetota bacterium]
MNDWVYCDNNATTRPLPEVVEAMLPFLREAYANPSSVHQFGQSVRHRVEVAREQVARLIGAAAKEIVFTSGGTESINLAIRGALSARRWTGAGSRPRRILTTAVEHSAVLRVLEVLEADEWIIDTIGVDQDGRIEEAEFAAKLADDTALVSLIHANNETGVVFDVARLAGIAADRGIPVHVDAVQSVGKLPIDVTDWPVQFVSMSAHKFHGPKGTGALYVRRRARISPLIHGGGQERGLRGGTENVAGVVGMGVAAETATSDHAETAHRVRALRDRLEGGILSSIPFAHVNGRGAERLYTTANIGFEGLEAEAILILLSEARICASAGAACSSGSLEPSHVLKAMGIDERIAHGAIRFSLSRFSTTEEIDHVVATLPGLLSRLTALSMNR